MQVFCFISYPKDACQKCRPLPAQATCWGADSGLNCMEQYENTGSWTHNSFWGINFLIVYPNHSMPFYFFGFINLKMSWKYCHERGWDCHLPAIKQQCGLGVTSLTDFRKATVIWTLFPLHECVFTSAIPAKLLGCKGTSFKCFVWFFKHIVWLLIKYSLCYG